MKLFAIEGNTQKLDGGAMYGNAPRAVWAQWSPPDEANRIDLACRALLVQSDDGRNILFETGIGAFFEPKLRERFGVVEPQHVLLENLRAVGITENDIDVVVLSHLHFDHAGGLLSAWEDGQPRLLFPRARYVVGAEHMARAMSPHVRDRASFVPVLQSLLQASGRLDLVHQAGPSSVAPWLQFHVSHGHTPGLLLSQLALGNGPLLFCADLIPGMPWVHLPITMGYDRFPELLIDEKNSLLTRLQTDHGALFFTHDPQTPCGSLSRTPQGRFSAVPVSLSSLV